MLIFHKINSISDPYFQSLFNLYSQAFPPSECRTREGITLEINTTNRFSAHALLKDKEFVGLLNYWNFDQFLYIEHRAISESLRGQRIGKEALTQLIEQTKQPIILEVEMPLNTMTIRRIRFYENSNFSTTSHFYLQPPYRVDGLTIPMQIMSNNALFANKNFELIRDTLYKEVYKIPFGGSAS